MPLSEAIEWLAGTLDDNIRKDAGNLFLHLTSGEERKNIYRNYTIEGLNVILEVALKPRETHWEILLDFVDSKDADRLLVKLSTGLGLAILSVTHIQSGLEMLENRVRMDLETTRDGILQELDVYRKTLAPDL